MDHPNTETERAWNEAASQNYIDNGRYFIPDRDVQNEALCALVPALEEPFEVLELGCGEGRLAEVLLERYPQCRLLGLDGSSLMLEHATKRLERFGERFHAGLFRLEESGWRTGIPRYRAVLASLLIHHLDGDGKAVLYRDLFGMLKPGGTLLIADIIQPAGESGRLYAAEAWNEVVRQQALEIDGDMRGFRLFEDSKWNTFLYPDPMDRPSGLFEQLQWLSAAGFEGVDVYWMKAGFAIFGGTRPSATAST